MPEAIIQGFLVVLDLSIQNAGSQGSVDALSNTVQNLANSFSHTWEIVRSL